MERIRFRVPRAPVAPPPRLSPSQRILALECSDGLNRVCTTDCLRSCFRKTEVLHLTFVDEFPHRSRYVFDGHVQVDTMLVEEIDGIHLSRLSDVSVTFLMCSGRL